MTPVPASLTSDEVRGHLAMLAFSGLVAGSFSLGAIVANDIDPQAITASLDNAMRNEVPNSQFSAHLPAASELDNWRYSADWVVANILAGPLIELEPILTSMMAPKGRLLLAGLLAEQAEQVIATYASKVKLAIADRQEEWVLLAGEAR